MKLFDKWKNEWWLNNARKLSQEFNDNRMDLIRRCQEEIKQAEDTWKMSKNIILQKIALEESEVAYRLKVLEERKLELIKADNDLKTQIKLLEAKASPSSVWSEAFGQGMSKCWDLALPFMQENIEKLKSKIREDAAMEAIKRLNNAPNKK